MDIETICEEAELPAHIHATVLKGRDIVTGELLAYLVMWADRPYDTCPLCREPVSATVGDCPVQLDTGAGQGGAIREWDKQHGCGQWLDVDWRQVTADGGEVTDANVRAAAADLLTKRQQRIADALREIEAELRKDLTGALARLAEPLDNETAEDRVDEVTTGSEVEPGVYLDDGEWLAWAYPPVIRGGDGTITVYASDLAATQDS